MSISPPPTYAHVLEENRLAALDNENIHTTIQHPLMPNIDDDDDDDGADENNDDHCNNPIHDNLNELNEQKSGDTYSYLNSNITTTPSQENFINCTGSSDPLFGSQHSGSHSELHHHGSFSHEKESEDEGGTCSRSVEWSNQNSGEWNNQNSNINRSYNEINEYIDNKSSKEMYKAAAKEWGISCKMSDGCRCMECQGHYFDCEYDDVSKNIFFSLFTEISAGISFFENFKLKNSFEYLLFKLLNYLCIEF